MSTLIKLTIGVAVALILVGAIAYTASDFDTVPAVSPIYIGGLMLILGVVGALRPATGMFVVLIAAVVAVIGIIGAIPQVADIFELMGGDGGEIERPAAVVSQSIMLVLCTAYLVLLAVMWRQVAQPSTGRIRF
jgi:hypothetical protein